MNKGGQKKLTKYRGLAKVLKSIPLNEGVLPTATYCIHEKKKISTNQVTIFLIEVTFIHGAWSTENHF